MRMKVLGTAVAAALLGLSTVTFGQGTSASGSSAASGQDTPREAAKAQAGPGSAQGGATGSATTGSGTVVTTPGVVVTTRCDAMTGEERTRCLRDERASTGSTAAGVPVTPKAGDSGPGAIDKTRPGEAGSGFSGSSRDTGTSSAGSPGGR